MKRNIAILLVLSMLMSLLAACGSNATAAPTAGAAEPTAVAAEPTIAAAKPTVAVVEPTIPPTEALVEPEGIKEIVISDDEWEGVLIHLLSTAPVSTGLVMDPLLNREPDGTYTANIAEGYTISEDGKSITVTIPDNLQYYDGTYVKPEDMKRSIEWGHDVSPYGSDWDAVTSVDVSGNDIIIHMDGGFSTTVLFYLGSFFWPIVSAEDIDTKTEEELLWNARVYGPYYVEEYVSGDHVTLKPNPYYKTNNIHVENKGPVKVDKITVRFMEDQFAIVQGLLAGDMDITSLVREELFSELESAGNLEIVSMPSDGVVNLLLNNDFELFKDERVRQAIMYLIDREQIEEYSNSTLSTAYSLLASINNGYDPAVEEWYKETYSNDKEMAKQLLSEAGWSDTDGDSWLDKDGQIFEFTVVDYRDNKIARELLQIQFQEFGIKMDLEVVEFPAWKETVQTNDTYEAAITSFYWADAQSTLPYIVRDKNLLPADTKYFELAVATGTTTNPEETKAIATDAQKILLGTTYYIPLVQPNRIMVFSDRVYEHIYYNWALWRFWLGDV